MLCLPNAVAVAWSSAAAAVPHLSTKIWSSNVNMSTNVNQCQPFISIYIIVLEVAEVPKGMKKDALGTHPELTVTTCFTDIDMTCSQCKSLQ